MRVIIIVILAIIVGWTVFSRDIIYTKGSPEGFHYKVDKIEPYKGGAIYNLNSRDGKGDKRSMEGRYDYLQIIDTIGAFNIGDEIILVPTKR